MLLRHASDSTWKKPEISAYPNEDALEQLLSSSPELLPGLETGPVIIARQVQTGVGPVDMLAVGLDGSIVLVECKLRANPEIRRAVVGQLFAYASSLWQTSLDTFERAVSARLGSSLISKARSASNEADWDETAFRANIERNLVDGRFRLVIAVDAITDELRRTIEYLNERTAGEIQVVALEIGYVKDRDVEIVLPRTYGTESSRGRSRGKGPIGPDELFQALETACSPEGVAAVRRLYDWVEPNGGSFAWGYGIAFPSTNAWFSIEGHRVAAWSCFARPSNATFEITFEYLAKGGVSIERMGRFAAALNEIEMIRPRLAGLEEASYRKRPSVSIDGILAKPGVTERLEKALGVLVDRPVSSQPDQSVFR